MDDIINLLESLMQQATALVDELSEDEMAQVLQIFRDAVELIQEQESQAPIEAPGQIGALPSSTHESSNVNGFKYDPESQELHVQFHGPYPNAAGPIYSYAGVPKYLFDIIEKGSVGPKTSGKNRYHAWVKGVTPSLGGTVNAILKAGGFKYEKIS